MDLVRILSVCLVTALLGAGCTGRPKGSGGLAAEEAEDAFALAAAQPLMEEKGLAPSNVAVRPGLDWVALEDFCRDQGVTLAQRASLEESPQYVLQTPVGTLEIRADSRQARWNGVLFWMGYGPKLFDQTPFLHRLDSEKNLVPLLQGEAIRATHRTLVLDPGHGGKDLGTQNSARRAQEKDLTLDWAFRARDLLRSRGWKVHLTRTNDVNLTLSERVQFADRVKADLFVSLHFNSSLPATNRAGVETYCLTPTGLPSTLVRYGEDASERAYPNNAHDTDNLLLAWNLQKSLVEKSGTMDRGVKRARFMTVLQAQQRPAVLIEGGFVSSSTEVEELLKPEYRQRLAEAVVDGLEPFRSKSRDQR